MIEVVKTFLAMVLGCVCGELICKLIDRHAEKKRDK